MHSLPAQNPLAPSESYGDGKLPVDAARTCEKLQHALHGRHHPAQASKQQMTALSTGTEARSPAWFPSALLIGALAAALAFRLYLLAANDFPVNDGALFLEFVRTTAATFPRLPAEAAYNGLTLPFAYPPLSFWLGALLTRLGADSLEVVRVLPIVMNIVYVGLFALLLLRSGGSRLFTALTILFLSATSLSFQWLMMGGGLSRGLGSIFLVLTLFAVSLPDRQRGDLSIWRAAAAGGAVGGAILSHLEWGILAAGCVVLSRALGSSSIKSFSTSCAVAGGTAFALILPWLLFVVQTHGLTPFLSAGGTSFWGDGKFFSRILSVIRLAVVSNPFAVIGFFVLLRKREWFWIGFLLLCVTLTPRHASTPATLANAVLGAQGIITAYRFAAGYVRSSKLLDASTVALITALLAFGVYRIHYNAPGSFRVLPTEMRQAMAWVAANHPGSRFVIVNDRAWYNDSTGEWFPTLARAYSVTTVQGREWNGEFGRWVSSFEALRESGSCTELHSNVMRFRPFDFVWVESRQECFPSESYQPVFRNGKVTIYRQRS